MPFNGLCLAAGGPELLLLDERREVAEGCDRRGRALGMRDGHLRGALSRRATQRQMDVLAAFVEAGRSVTGAALM